MFLALGALGVEAFHVELRDWGEGFYGLGLRVCWGLEGSGVRRPIEIFGSGAPSQNIIPLMMMMMIIIITIIMIVAVLTLLSNISKHRWRTSTTIIEIILVLAILAVQTEDIIRRRRRRRL